MGGRPNDTDTVAYMNHDKGNGWHMVGFMSWADAKQIIAKRRKAGDLPGTDYMFRPVGS